VRPPRERSAAVELALRLTLLDLLLRPIGDEFLRPLILGIAASGLLFRRATRLPALWWSLAALTGLRVAIDYPLPDNHAYLLFYWCLAIALASVRIVDDANAFIAWNARHLIGLAFAFAVLWKLALSPDFVDGRFFRVSLMTDPRFGDLTRLLGSLSFDALESQREFLMQHADGALAHPDAPTEPARIRVAARAMTIWTLFIEGAIALCFLWPREGVLARARDACLLVFCATTYAFATVAGFGWLLIAMGVAQTAPDRKRTRAVYVAVFALILVYREVRWLEPLLP
jgi:hypothetical protein